MRSLTPVEAALAFAIGGSVLAVFLPPFIRNLHASRLTEPLAGLERISARAAALADAAPALQAYPPSVALTPAQVPRGELVVDPPGTWAHPTWRLLDFSLEAPHAFSFEFVSNNSAQGSTYTATAHGDLDGDGVQSTFQVSGVTRPGNSPETSPLEVMREVE
ncbi:MAG: hypothetical protein K0R38_7650 [Polyangiaceae bacterium]|jgi:hypothetical protein|nr:hypothetical protein [Polyangiaceae bacterium]